MSALHRVYCTFAVHHEKSLVPAFFKISIDHLFVNLESGKIKYCLEEVWKKSWIVNPKICGNLEERTP